MQINKNQKIKTTKFTSFRKTGNKDSQEKLLESQKQFSQINDKKTGQTMTDKQNILRIAIDLYTNIDRKSTTISHQEMTKSTLKI